MDITIQELQDIIANSVEMGIQQYVRNAAPTSDRISQSEAKRYIKRLGFKPVMLQKWVDAGLIEGYKNGTNRNDIRYYSMTKLKGVLSSLRLKNIANDKLI
ncbi:MAG: hypothetical protein IJ197_08870 [Bacteroidaceae bacterium]|nr:hypothetical protein [Bacteroidaceae bacterium]